MKTFRSWMRLKTREVGEPACADLPHVTAYSGVLRFNEVLTRQRTKDDNQARIPEERVRRAFLAEMHSSLEFLDAAGLRRVSSIV
jgi:hypothetical protein